MRKIGTVSETAGAALSVNNTTKTTIALTRYTHTQTHVDGGGKKERKGGAKARRYQPQQYSRPWKV